MIEVDMRNSGGMDFSLQFLLLPNTLLALMKQGAVLEI